MDRDEPRARAAGRSPLLFVFLTVFIDLLGFGIVIPLLPVYSQAYGASESELGLLFASFSGMQLVFAPLWGRVSDRIGRKPVLVGGLVGTAGAYALFALADSMPLLFASRLLAGFFGANIATAQAYIADVTRPEDRARGMGLIGAAFGLGFTLGPPIGGALSLLSPGAPGWFACGLSLCAATFGALTLREHAPEQRRGSRVFGLAQLARASGDPRVATLLALGFLAIFAFSAFEAMLTRYGLERFPAAFGIAGDVDAASRDEVLRAGWIAGAYLGGVGIVSAVIQGGLIRRLVPRFGETRLAIAGPFFLALSLLVVALAPAWWVVVVGCTLLPIGFGLNNPALAGLLSRAAPVGEQGAYLGLNQSVASSARLTGPPIAGLLFQHVGPAWPFLTAAFVLFVATAIARWYHARYAATFPRGAAAA